jgi:hypothetical protein
MSPTGRVALALLLAGCGSAVGFLEGRALADGRFAPTHWFAGERARTAARRPPDAAQVPARISAPLRELFASLAELRSRPPRIRRRPGATCPCAREARRATASRPTRVRRRDARAPSRSARRPSGGAPRPWSEVAARAGTRVRDGDAHRGGSTVIRCARAARGAGAVRGRDGIRGVAGEADPASTRRRRRCSCRAAADQAPDDALAQWRAGCSSTRGSVAPPAAAWLLENSRPGRRDGRGGRRAQDHLAAAAALLPESETLLARRRAEPLTRPLVGRARSRARFATGIEPPPSPGRTARACRCSGRPSSRSPAPSC